MADMSFLPEDYLERRVQRRTNVICLGLFVVVIGAVLGAFFVKDRERADVRVLQRQVNQQFIEAGKRLEQLDQLQARKQEMVRKAQVTALLIEPVPRTLVMSELVNSMPQSLSLIDLSLETRAVKAVRPAGGTSALEQAKKARSKAAAAKSNVAAPEPELPRTEVLVQMIGIAPTDVEVSNFMTTLGKNPLFSELNLAFSESASVESQEVRRFRVDMKLNQTVDLREHEPLMVRRTLKHNPMASPPPLMGPDGQLLAPGRSAVVNVSDRSGKSTLKD